jgi:hypothetical protein
MISESAGTHVARLNEYADRHGSAWVSILNIRPRMRRVVVLLALVAP